MSPKVLNILLLAMSYVLYSYVITPLYFGGNGLIPLGESVPSLVKKNNNYDSTLIGVDKIIKDANDTRKQYDEITKEDKDKMYVMIPTSINDIKFMKELTLSVLDTGIPLDSMSIKDKGNGEYAVSFSVLTTYTKFKMYMNYWENSLRLYSLKSVTFSPGKTEDSEIKFNVELSTYYMK